DADAEQLRESLVGGEPGEDLVPTPTGSRIRIRLRDPRGARSGRRLAPPEDLDRVGPRPERRALRYVHDPDPRLDYGEIQPRPVPVRLHERYPRVRRGRHLRAGRWLVRGQRDGESGDHRPSILR